ncbi:LysM and putative peptidoglycan-binding domain-containing protein 1 [Rhizophlyctis rosea]|nr:LysM and putative peptidoglycan-binding domain-containing protein 1 [Rhizophlyctis rosea]
MTSPLLTPTTPATPRTPVIIDPLSAPTTITPTDIEHAIAAAKAQRKKQKQVRHVQGGNGSGASSPASPADNTIAAAAGASIGGAPEIIVHEIKPGDTLEGICLMYSVKASDIKRYNRLWTNDSIHLRKTLDIPIRATTSSPSPFQSPYLKPYSHTSSLTPSPCPSPRPTPIPHSRSSTQTNTPPQSTHPPPQRVDDLLKKVDEDLVQVLKQMEISGLGEFGVGEDRKMKKPLYPPPPGPFSVGLGSGSQGGKGVGVRRGVVQT